MINDVTDLPRELFVQCFTVHQFVDWREETPKERKLDRIESYRLSFVSPVVSYLTYRDWVQFDIALTNCKVRKEYLRIISGLTILHPLRSEIKSYPLFIEWAKLRKLQLRGVVMDPQSLDLLRMYANSLLSKVEEILVPTPPKELFIPTVSLITRISSTGKMLVFDGNDRITVPALKKIMKASPLLTTLSVRGCRYINTHVLHHLPRFAPNLTALYMSKCRLLAEEVIAAVGSLPRLQILDLSSCISFHTASIIVEIRPSLQEFYINNLLGSFQHSRPDIVRNQLQSFATNLQLFGTELRALSIQESSLLTDTILAPWILAGARHHGGINRLEYLSVASCRNITDELLNILAQYCRHLLVLDVRDCGLLTDHGVSLIGSQCRNIRDVALDGCFQLTHESIFTFYREKSSERVNISIKQCYRIARHLLNYALLTVSLV